MTLRHLIGPVALATACDPGAAPEPDEPARVQPLHARNGQAPELAPPIECEPTLPLLEPLGELPLAWLEPDPPWVRRLDEVTPLTATRSLVVGQYGDFIAEGIVALAFDDDGSTAWSAVLPATEEIRQVLVEPTPGAAWLVARQRERTEVWRLDADGTALLPAAVSVEGVEATRVLPTPSDGLLLLGIDEAGLPTFAELSAAGVVQWQGGHELVPIDHVVTTEDGLLQRFDAAGALVWEHDPRPEPYPGFPLDVGATWTRLTPSGEVVGLGTVVGPGGQVPLLLRLHADGQPRWSHLRPRVSIDRVRLGSDERLLVVGRAWECEVTGYVAVLDDNGDAMAEGRTGPSVLLGVDAQHRVLSVDGANDAEITLHWYAEVSP